MNTHHNIFTIKAISFEKGELDPFGFDDFSEKLGAEYLPFSSIVAKPAYFLFVAYVNYILKERKIPWKSLKEKKEIQVRLEKLLVYCWKKSIAKGALRGASVIGYNFDLEDIDVFTAKGWVKQNAFKIYTTKNFVPKTFEKYMSMIGKTQIPLLLEFISTQYKQPKLKGECLNVLIKRLKKKNSLFNNPKLESGLRQKFRKELLEKISDKKKLEYIGYIKPFFQYESLNKDRFLKKTLDHKDLPFVHLNNWFRQFISAVDSEINSKGNSKAHWKAADKAFNEIPEKFLSTSKSSIKLERRQKPTKWFRYNGNQYSFPENAKKSEIRKIKRLWDSYKKRAGEEVGTRYFFTFRHFALIRLLKELQN